jgi:hypothetical protein
MLAESFVRWLNPRPQWRWFVYGSDTNVVAAIVHIADPQVVHVLDESAVPSGDDLPSPAKRVTGALADINVSFTPFDAAIATSIAEGDSAVRFGMDLVRLVRLNGIVAACVVANGGATRQQLWDLWLDARVNDVTTTVLHADAATDGQAGARALVIRGTR